MSSTLTCGRAMGCGRSCGRRGRCRWRGYSWRAIRDGRGYLRSVLLTALSVALHFETGYLALSVLLVWPLVAGRPLLARLRRAAVLLGGSLLAAAWVIIP